MAVTGDSTTTDAEFFQIHYQKWLGSDLFKSRGLPKMIDEASQKIELGGKNLDTTWGHETAAGVGMSALTEGGTFATPRYSSAINFTLALTHMSLAAEFTGHVEAQGTSAKFGGKSIKEDLAKKIRDKAQLLAARWLMHTGSPILCTTTAASGTTNGYVTITGCPLTFFVEGEYLNFYNAAASGSSVLTNAATGAGRIVKVDYDNSRVYIADATGLTGGGGDYCTWDGFYDKTVPNGIRNLVDSSGTVQGVNRATVGNQAAIATEFDWTGTTMGPTLVDILRDRVEKIAERRSSKYQTLWAFSRAARRDATVSVIGQNRFTDLDMTLGVAKLKVADKDGTKLWIEDDMLPDTELYALCLDRFVQGYAAGMKGGYPLMNGSSPYFQGRDGNGAVLDLVQMFWVLRYNTGCRDFRCQGKGHDWDAP